jgi:hypothetical protein
MSLVTRFAGRRALAAGMVAIAALSFGGSGAFAQPESPESVNGSPQASPPVLPGEPNPPWEDGATPAEVNPALENIRPHRWDYVLVAPDGRTATVYFTNGVPECYGLADVQVTEASGGVRILLWVGDVPGAEVCVETVQLYRTVVVLDDRLVEGGSLLDLPSGFVGGAWSGSTGADRRIPA